MLYNPKWNLSAFIAWLETMPAKKAYDWRNYGVCACAQFHGGADWLLTNRAAIERDGTNLNGLAYGTHGERGEWTFGALLERAKRERDRVNG